jgi:hypothetical protein
VLVIRKAQERALGRALFDNWILVHVGRYFPEHCAALRSAGVSAVVTEAVAAARQLGFEGDSEVTRFVDLTFMFGPGFHHGERWPWARRALDDKTLSEPRQRMERLYGDALDYLRAAAGSTRDLDRNAETD